MQHIHKYGTPLDPIPPVISIFDVQKVEQKSKRNTI